VNIWSALQVCDGLHRTIIVIGLKDGTDFFIPKIMRVVQLRARYTLTTSKDVLLFYIVCNVKLYAYFTYFRGEYDKSTVL
jgi:hypothetical protein